MFFIGALALVIIGLTPYTAAAQHPSYPGEGDTAEKSKPAVLMSGLGNHSHPIATSSAEAQRFFDQGLTLVFAFNHEEAVRSFRRAAELDPQSPMPHWGIALALGPNINRDVDPAGEIAAYQAVQKAFALAAGARGNEQAYIEALAKRYSNDPKADLKKLAADYRDAMKELIHRYPDDLDAAVLYAESIMDLSPWQLWSLDGRPAEGTEELINTLESVLRRDPLHIGANHYYIHAVEASPHPERALASAMRLETLVPAAGHLVHMPAHIYMRTGNYEAAAQSNSTAAQADRAYLRGGDVKGLYPLMYYSHNLHFLAVAQAMRGRSSDARRAAVQMAANVSAHAAEVPDMEQFAREWGATTPILVAARCSRWDEILQLAQPDQKLVITNALWRYARGMAYTKTGQAAKAESERRAFESVRATVPKDTLFGLNRASDVLSIAGFVLDARIAAAKGNRTAAISHFEKAVAAEDALAYDEPSNWYYPVRESLGATLLLEGQADRAEEVFRADLTRNPRNGRSLFGLWESLKAQKRLADAEWVRREFETAWKGADITLQIEDL